MKSGQVINCERCRFWKAPERPDVDELGECRRHAPKAAIFRWPEEEDPPRGFTMFPETFGDQWCGEADDRDNFDTVAARAGLL